MPFLESRLCFYNNFADTRLKSLIWLGNIVFLTKNFSK